VRAVLNTAGLGDATGRAESMLGRRLRPWWGQAPSKLLIGGLVRAGLFGLIIYGCWQVRYGSVDLTEIDLADGSLEDHRSTIETAAVWVAAVSAVLALYNLIQVAVGAIDLFVRRHVEGQLLAAQERRTGDFLPGIVQHFWFRSRDRSGMNRSVRRRRTLRGGDRHLARAQIVEYPVAGLLQGALAPRRTGSPARQPPARLCQPHRRVGSAHAGRAHRLRPVRAPALTPTAAPALVAWPPATSLTVAPNHNGRRTQLHHR
jgi:hypothetical protein